MLSNYLKIAWRSLWNNRGYSLVTTLGLSVGIACCILVGLYVAHELSFESHHEKAERVYRVAAEMDFNGNRRFASSSPGMLGPAAEEQVPGVEESATLTLFPQTLIQQGETSGYETVHLTGQSLFDLFTVPFVEGDVAAALASPETVVLSQEMARKYFGEEHPVGQTLLFRGETELTVTGVFENPPAGTDFPLHMLVNPGGAGPTWSPYSGGTTFLLLEESADPELVGDRLFELAQSNSDNPYLAGYRLERLDQIHFARTFGATGELRYIYIFSIVALFLFLIANINHINLSIARMIPRSREVGIRKTLGAQRSQLAGQFLTETFLLGLTAVILGLILAEMAWPVVNALPGVTLAALRPGDVRFLAALAGLVALTTLLSGSYIVFYVSRLSPSSIFRRKSMSSAGSSLLRRGLVTFQFAASIALVCCTLIAQQQLNFISESRLGFDREHLVVLDLKDDLRQRYGVLKDRLAGLGGVQSVAASEGVPGGAGFSIIFLGEENPVPNINIMAVENDFPSVMEMELISGDREALAEGDWLMNESAARALGITEANGQLLSDLLNVDAEEYPGEVAGIVQDFNYVSLHNDVRPLLMPVRSSAFSNLSIRLEPGSVNRTMDQVRELWSEFAPGIPLDYFFLDDRIDSMYRSDRRFAEVFWAFSLITILIACMGLFGLAALSAEQRTREIGIRKVLGATVSGIVALLGKDFIRLVAVGFVIAAPVSWHFMNRWLADFAYRTEPGIGVFVLAGGAALLVALLTVSWQSIRAARANPVESLRSE